MFKLYSDIARVINNPCYKEMMRFKPWSSIIELRMISMKASENQDIEIEKPLDEAHTR